MIQVTYSQEFDNIIVKDSTDEYELLKEQEFLKYDIKSGIFSVGKINFKKKILKDSKINIFDLEGYTKGFVKLFLKLNVNYKSFYLEKENLTLKLVKLINEGDNKKIEEILFDNTQKKVYYQNKKNKKGKFFFYENKLFDLISGFHFFRSNINNIYDDSSLFYMSYIHNGDGIKTIKIELLGNDRISISNVNYRTKKFVCVFDSKNKLLKNKSEVYFWISDDQFNLPLRFETKVMFYKVRVELKNVDDYLK